MTAGERIAAWIANDADAGEADYAARIDAAIVAAESSALERAAQVFENRGPRIQSGYEAAALLRALASPAAAPAAEVLGVCDYCIIARERPHPRSEECGNWRSAPPPEPVAPAIPERLKRDAALTGKLFHLAPPEPDTGPDPDVEPVAPSLLPRVLAVLDAEYRRRGGDDGGGYVGALAAELRRYIATDPRDKRIAELEAALSDWRAVEAECGAVDCHCGCHVHATDLADGGEPPK